MYIYLLAVYSVVSTMDCYTQRSQLNLFSDHLEIQLNRESGVLCDFPTGVLVQLQFPDSSLNIGQIFTGFSYNKTISLKINCGTKCAAYDDVISSTVVIDSPQLTTVFSIGSVLNIRKKLNSITPGVHLTVEGDQSCIVIDQANIGKDLTERKAILKIHSDREGKSEFDKGVEKFDSKTTSYCFTATSEIPYVDMAILMLTGLQNGIHISQNYTTSDIVIVKQPNIFTGLTTTIFSSYMALEFQRNKGELDKFMLAADFSKANFIIKMVIKDTHHYISGKINENIFKSDGNMVCAVTENEEDCLFILTQMQRIQLTDRYIIFYFQIGDQLIIQQVGVFKPSCFSGLDILIFSKTIEFQFQMTSSKCVLEQTNLYTFKVGYFNIPEDFSSGITLFKDTYDFSLLYNSSMNKIINNISNNEFAIIEPLRDHKYVVIYVYNEDDDFQDQIVSNSVEQSLRSTYIMFSSLSVICSSIFCVIMFVVSIIPKRIHVTHKIKIINPDEI
ncbi:hypothetical protein SS50377_21840 [Spironucleus salmonicida]|uniref:Uncharacterized protein n=1 Tax=Spironucleus salmonicida TaxID=348837 RepID=V6LUA2_9EUKA|nr:hypothetical protein SS50377_21840 [Spironucleus salmonicida]|eukprot:EST44384.1 Hypothetical protein SS50377_15687 [Spironucleus salmonicida]